MALNKAAVIQQNRQQKSSMEQPVTAIKGRGALSNLQGRYDKQQLAIDTETLNADLYDDNWLAESLVTEVSSDHAKSIIAKNNSPDIPFSQSINPYQGCEHGCIYCFARPTHSYWDLSPGLDFETRLRYKANAEALLKTALSNPRYRCQPIALGTNTDPYQPIESQYQVTRKILQVLLDFKHPVTIVTKGVLIERDLELLADMAAKQLCTVRISITTLDESLRQKMEPRAPSARARLKTISALKNAGIPVGVMVAPMIPSINDHELEAILAAARDAGAQTAGYIFLRLPHEIKELFADWLAVHFPGRRQHVLNLIRESRGGGLYNSEFGQRMRGTGCYADLLQQRFNLAVTKLRMSKGQGEQLTTALFRTTASSGQMSLFDNV